MADALRTLAGAVVAPPQVGAAIPTSAGDGCRWFRTPSGDYVFPWELVGVTIEVSRIRESKRAVEAEITIRTIGADGLLTWGMVTLGALSRKEPPQGQPMPFIL